MGEPPGGGYRGVWLWLWLWLRLKLKLKLKLKLTRPHARESHRGRDGGMGPRMAPGRDGGMGPP